MLALVENISMLNTKGYGRLSRGLGERFQRVGQRENEKKLGGSLPINELLSSYTPEFSKLMNSEFPH